MTLLLFVMGMTFSPADSARALVDLRYISEAAVLYAQMAAVEDGVWLVEYGRFLEAAGDFQQARQIYGLALGRSTSDESVRWLLNRRAGTVLVDTTLIIDVRVENTGTVAARNVQVLLPEPRQHPPFQELFIVSSDFTPSMQMLTAEIPCISPGETITLTLGLRILQQPGTMRPIPETVDEEELNWLSEAMRNLPVPEVLPGPCVPMCQEMVRLGRENGVTLTTTGGVILDDGQCIFHAWNVLEGTGVRIDPLLFKTDSLLAVAHNPTDVIPLWELDSTDGYELTLLFDNSLYQLTGEMTARLK